MNEERQQQSQAAILAGGLPLNAVDRLREQASRVGTPQAFFTSDLSVSELALTHQCGFEPLGQVMGSCIYHVGWYAGPGWAWTSGELDILTRAYYDARHLAMSRLQQEAKMLHATGVVGVRLTAGSYDWETGLIEFMAVGTAVRESNAPPLPDTALPFVSSLSGQDHYALRQGGYRPVGFAMGNCTWFQYASWRTQTATAGFFNSMVNQELTDYTQGTYFARELAMSRMQHEARSVNGAGIVGVKVETSHEVYEVNNSRGLIIHFTAMGTAVARDWVPSKTVDAKMVVSLG